MASVSLARITLRLLSIRLLALLLTALTLAVLVPAGRASAATPSPIGGMNSVQLSNTTNTVTLVGWTVDPSHRDRSNSVLVTIDHRSSGGWRGTTLTRSDVNRSANATGNHGFRITFALPVGRHTVCLTARPAAAATPTASLGCWVIQAYAKPTKANMSAIAKTIDPHGTINWVWTPSTRFTGQAEPWNGRILISSTGNQTRYLRAIMLHEWSHVLQYRAFGSGDGWWNAVQAFNALLGDAHDQDSYTGLEHGADCMALAMGANYLSYGCPAALRVFGTRIARGAHMDKPQGALGSAVASGHTMTVTGWSIDPANPVRSNTVRVTDNGKVVTGWTATTGNRPDINTINGVTGRHGFRLSVSVSAGRHQICVAAAPAGPGSAATLTGCRSVVVS